MKPRLVAAMSGGVDSCVAVKLAMDAGFEVFGLTLLLKHPDPEFSRGQQCFHPDDARSVADVVGKLGIKHLYLDRYPDFYRQVLRPSALEYARGRTPNPCCICNPLIKFKSILEYADSVGAEKALTGHYARIVEREGKFFLRRGVDQEKDQTYFLYRLGQQELARLWFPLGELSKKEVRLIAEQSGFYSASKRDSQDGCFQVPGESFGETLRRAAGLERREGFFLYQGKKVGRHGGIHCYTLGQRKGLNVALGVPGYIKSIDPESGNIELVTDQEQLGCSSFYLSDEVWTEGHFPEDKELMENLEVQIRYRSRPVSCRIRRVDGATRVEFVSPVRAVTPGQSAVFYSGDLLLGGGVINLEKVG